MAGASSSSPLSLSTTSGHQERFSKSKLLTKPIKIPARRPALLGLREKFRSLSNVPIPEYSRPPSTSEPTPTISLKRPSLDRRHACCSDVDLIAKEEVDMSSSHDLSPRKLTQSVTAHRAVRLHSSGLRPDRFSRPWWTHERSPLGLICVNASNLDSDSSSEDEDDDSNVGTSTNAFLDDEEMAEMVEAYKEWLGDEEGHWYSEDSMSP
ncbi:MAG: hypothetical protein Q9157_005298 [Trypethelium eluteriae]